MKKTILNIIAAASLAAILGIGCAVAASHIQYNEPDETLVENEYEFNYPTDGMFFSAEYVAEEYETDGGLWIVYTDPDAGLEECHIQVDANTYNEILHAISHGNELVGALVETDEPGVYTYMTAPEFEMANASAKI